MDYIKYFSGRGVNFDQLANIALSKFNMDREILLAGAANLYNDICNGLVAKDLSLSHMIISKGKLINTSPPSSHQPIFRRLEKLEDFRRLEKLEDVVKRLEYQTQQLSLHWWNRDKWQWLFVKFSPEDFPPTM